MKRVLMFTPTNRLEPEALTALMDQTYRGPLDRMITRDNPETVNVHQNIAYNYRKAQRIFLAEGYDALFIVESDVIIPPDALERLLAIDCDIAYGVYCFRRGMPVLNITHPTTYQTFSGHLKEWKEHFGQVIECSGLGFGCTVIHRNVLERHELHSDDGGGNADTVLAKWARANGVRQMADTAVLCGHKRPDGVTLWPGRERTRREGVSRPILRAVRSVIPFSGWTADNVLYIARPGDAPRWIEEETAALLVGAGMAEYANIIHEGAIR